MSNYIYESFKQSIMDDPFSPIFYAWSERRLSILERVRRFFTGEDPRVIPVYRDTIWVSLSSEVSEVLDAPKR